MNRLRAFIFLLLVASFILACGSGSNRQLQSISITSTVNGNLIQLVATGTFSAPPSTVTPLSVFWAIDVPPAQYTLTTQPLSIDCAPGEYQGPFLAMAPVNPNAPSSGSLSTTKMISQSTSCTDVK